MGKNKTGPECHVCVHVRRHLIELALVHKLPMRVIAKRFEVSKWSVFRHRQNHMSPQLIAALTMAQRPADIDLEALQRSESEGLLASLISQRARLALLSEMCFEQGELHAAVTVERATTASLELTSKLLGMIVQRHDVRSTSILIICRLHPAAGRHRHRAEAVPRGCARPSAPPWPSSRLEAAKDIAESKKPLLLEASPC